MEDSQHVQPFGRGKWTLRCRERSRSEERASRFVIQRNDQPLCARGTTRTSKRRRMCSTQRLGWLSSSYSSTLATKLDGAGGKARRLVKDEIMQSGRCCVMTERVVQSLQRRSCPVRDKIMRRYDQELLGAPLWCTTQQEEGLWIQGCHAAGELDCFSAHIRLREPDKSKDEAEKEVDSEEHHSVAEADLPIVKEGMQMQGNEKYVYELGNTMVSQRRDFHGVINPLLSWRESIGRKNGAEEVENVKANSKYQDRADGQRPRNFIRLVLMGFSSR
ncbi:hypothetical protein B296_00017088 [Ensete ventricosum]|uniref:Uncharacterized protein n=1 Tax=Ensete ventricosum TaxID=4639 RepID=A0A426YV56_ENSVE|nr:hypothetical protein B296_00017088 [Ensete ventricosum]